MVLDPTMRTSRTRIVTLTSLVAFATALIAATVVTSTTTLALPGPSESTIVTVEPTRALDTRINVGLTGNFTSNTPRKLTVTGPITTSDETTGTTPTKTVIPPGATGVIMNVTSYNPTGAGWIAIRPGDATGQPATSNLNVTPGQIVPNAVTVSIPTTGPNAGHIDITYGAAPNNTTGVIIDIIGYTTSTGLADLVARVQTLETNGTSGPAGPTGPTGPRGPAGPAGADGSDLYARTVIVKNDGTATSNGIDLLAAIAAAPIPTAAAPFVIELEAGPYDVGSSTVTLPNYMSLRGAGTASTTLKGQAIKVVAARGHTTISDLTIESSTSVAEAEVVELGISAADTDFIVHDARVIATSSSNDLTDGIDARGTGITISNTWVNARRGALKVASGTTVEVVSSILVSEDAALLTLSGGSTVDIIGSHLESTSSSVADEVLRVQTSGHTVRISNSTLVATAAPSISFTGTDQALSIFNSHIDTPAPIVNTATTSTLTCSALSTPTAFFATGCV